MAIRHTKTNTQASWTQADIDAEIAAGRLPPGTLLSGFTVASDWNSDHTNPDIADVTGLQAALDDKVDSVNGQTGVVVLPGAGLALTYSGVENAVGDSITAGQGTTGSNRYSARIATAKGWTETNLAVGGSTVESWVSNQIASKPIAAGDVTVMMAGFNNARYNGADATKLAQFKRCLKATIAYAAVGDSDRVYSQDASGNLTTVNANYSGTWNTSPTWIGVQAVSRCGAYSNVSGDYVEFTVTGDVVHVMLGGYFGISGSTCTITVDGVDSGYGPINTTPTSASADGSAPWMPYLVSISGLINGSHTVRVTLTASVALLVGYAAGLDSSSFSMPAVFVGNTLRMTSTGYALAPANANDSVMATFQSTVFETVNELRDEGLLVTYSDIDSTWQPNTTTLDADDVHPNNIAHLAYANEMLGDINALFVKGKVPGKAGSTSSSGTGDVAGPASATDNAISRFDGTTGKMIQNSAATIDDSGNVVANSYRVELSGTAQDAYFGNDAAGNYPGIWFGAGASTYTVSDYAFLFNAGAKQTNFNNPAGGSMHFRIGNDSGDGLFYDKNLVIGGAFNATPTAKLDVRGNAHVVSASATALAVGANGSTNPAWTVDTSTASSATGMLVKSAAAGGETLLTTTDSGSDGNLRIATKGNGYLDINAGGGLALQFGTYRFSGGTFLSQYSFRGFSSNPAIWTVGYAAVQLPASTEVPQVLWDFGQVNEHQTGAITNQREFRFIPATRAFVGASTITNAMGLSVDGAPIVGTNATITNTSTIHSAGRAVGAATNSYGLNITANTGATNNYAARLVGTTQLFGGVIHNYVAVTSTYSVLDTDYVVNATSGTFTITLPTAVGRQGQRYEIKNSGTGVITIATTSSQTIDGGLTAVLSTQYNSIALISDGANWGIY